MFGAWHRLRPPAERVVILIRSFVLDPASHVHLPNTLIYRRLPTLSRIFAVVAVVVVFNVKPP